MYTNGFIKVSFVVEFNFIGLLYNQIGTRISDYHRNRYYDMQITRYHVVITINVNILSYKLASLVFLTFLISVFFLNQEGF